MRVALFIAIFWMMMNAVWAGAQREEALSDAVRSALSAALVQSAPPQPVHATPAMAQDFARWLSRNETRLQQQIQSRERAKGIDPLAPGHELDSALLRKTFLQTVWYESQRAGLAPSLVLGLIQVESGFRKYAISSAGARGYMQVMPFWAQQLSDGDASVLFQTQANLRFGCVILRHYLDLENGDFYRALGRYNGSLGQMAYPRAVLAAQAQWQ
jgi:soluble lytic murein transglycosylase-like protein